MIFTKRLQKKIRGGPTPVRGKKGGKSSLSPTYTKQNYVPFKKKSSGKSSFLRKSMEKTAGFFAGFRGVELPWKKRAKDGFRPGFLVVFLLVLGIGALVYFDGSSITGIFSKVEYFEVGDNVVIRGCHVTTPADIRELAEIRYHTNLFSVNPERLTAILERHPWINKATIKREWPNKLIIGIVEHVPEALATVGPVGQEHLYYLDNKGVPFVKVKPGQDLDFPVITGMKSVKLSGKRRQMFEDALRFIRLVKRNDPNLPAQSISEIHLDPTEGMVVYLVEYPFPIYFGTGDIHKKYNQLIDVLGVLYKQSKKGMLISQVEYIRMDYLDNKVLVAQSRSS